MANGFARCHSHHASECLLCLVPGHARDIGIRVSSEGASFLVLSENAYPGWLARVDGAEVPISRADVTLQGIVVPAGTHRVEFMLESRSLRAGMFVTGGAALAILALLIV